MSRRRALPTFLLSAVVGPEEKVVVGQVGMNMTRMCTYPLAQ